MNSSSQMSSWIIRFIIAITYVTIWVMGGGAFMIYLAFFISHHIISNEHSIYYLVLYYPLQTVLSAGWVLYFIDPKSTFCPIDRDSFSVFAPKDQNR